MRRFEPQPFVRMKTNYDQRSKRQLYSSTQLMMKLTADVMSAVNFLVKPVPFLKVYHGEGELQHASRLRCILSPQLLAFCCITRAMQTTDTMFSLLKYPEKLNSTLLFHVLSPPKHRINLFPHRLSPIEQTPFMLSYRLKIQTSADIVCVQLKYLSQKVQTTVQPVFVNQKIEQDLELQEVKPPVVNQQCLIYKFKCGLCDARYVGFTRCYMHQRIKERRNSTSSIGKHFGNKHSLAPRDPTKNFSVLKKCTNKFDCLFYEMFLYNN